MSTFHVYFLFLLFLLCLSESSFFQNVGYGAYISMLCMYTIVVF